MTGLFHTKCIRIYNANIYLKYALQFVLFSLCSALLCLNLLYKFHLREETMLPVSFLVDIKAVPIYHLAKPAKLERYGTNMGFYDTYSYLRAFRDCQFCF